jgi:hypothetical protein
MAVPGSAGASWQTTFDLAATRRYLLRILRLDETVFADLARDQLQTAAALALPAILLLGTTISSWLWLVLAVDDGLDGGAILARQVIGGTIVAYASWVLWVFVVERMLTLLWNQPVDRRALFRVMGFASLPVVLTWILWLPDNLQGDDAPFGTLAVAILFAAASAWLVLSHRALAAVTGATENHRGLANLVGYLVFLAILGLISRSGMAPGIPLFTRGFREYIDFGGF